MRGCSMAMFIQGDMMRQAIVGGVAALGILTLQAGAVAAQPRDPSGTFLTEDGRARIRLEKCGEANENVCGYVVWLQSPTTENGMPRTDLKNSDRRKTGRQLLGHQLVMGLKPKDDRYEGLIYNSEDGRSYDVNIWLASQNELKVKGCLLAVLCSTQSWGRKTDVAPGQLAAATGAPGGPTADPEWAKAPAQVATPRGGAKPRTQ